MTNIQLMVSERAVKEIQSLIKKAEHLKIVESENRTGFSYFTGKKRLCKILKTKKGVCIEINVELPSNLDIPELNTISKSEAYKKHLGTMRHIYRGDDIKVIKRILSEILKIHEEQSKVQEA